MSISSHLTPEPERRLWIMHGNIDNSLKWADKKLGAVTAFAAVQMAVIKIVAPEGVLSYIALLALCAALPVGVFGISPFIETRKHIPLHKPREAERAGDSLITEYDIAGYSQMELVNFLDKYFGGGITATRYFEDIIARIVIGARIVTRKRRLFMCSCVLAGTAQLCLLVQLVLR
ncbi:MAG: hypothetical protein NTX59_12825 [Elusimicrobia bacterium]|nr:hypothetical protein [Elusimicrobiota bacterium]